MSVQLDWFTTEVLPDGRQKVHIRARDARESEPLYLDLAQSQILMATLDHIAQDVRLHWTAARQAVLQGFWKALRPQS